MSEAENSKTRLNKFISDTGFCSRREADKLIEEGRVSVNGSLALLGTKVDNSDEVLVNGKPIRTKEKPVYIAMNKPVGIICTTDRKIKHNIIDFINHPKRIFPIGRLDRPSEGLIFLTNDGDIVNKILRAGNNHEKEYIVSVHKPITDDFVKQMADGIPILETVTKKCFVKQTGKNQFRIILTQGLNRQIRRMCEYLGYEVTRLKRVRIMNVNLSGIEVGKWRYLTTDEMDSINKSVKHSVKTEEASHTHDEEAFD
ncbi:MAG: 23S rRNA pseudouridine(2604) synthase RluF [Flavobacteriales bacterium]